MHKVAFYFTANSLFVGLLFPTGMQWCKLNTLQQFVFVFFYKRLALSLFSETPESKIISHLIY